MKKGVLVLAVVALTVPLYAQPSQESLSRAEVLDIFARFNPSVLEKAQQNPQYNEILQQFLDSYSTDISRNELIAAVRNFDNSIRLRFLLETYYTLWTGARLSGTDATPIRQKVVSDVTDVMEQVWAVTVSLRAYELQQAQTQLAQLRADHSRTDFARASEEQQLREVIKALQAELKSLRKNPGQYVLSAAEGYVAGAEEQFAAQTFAPSRQPAQQYEQMARQSENLQIKSKNKKPVAK